MNGVNERSLAEKTKSLLTYLASNTRKKYKKCYRSRASQWEM